MMEEKWRVPTADGHTIYGVKNPAAQPTKTAIFIVHGLTGHMYEYSFKRAADYFSSKWDVFRFNLYDGEEGARSLPACTVQTHADDLNTVLNYFHTPYQKIFLIGHSYGGPTIMMANPACATAASLWDPTFNLQKVQGDFQKAYQAIGDNYIVNWGTSYIIGKAMYDEAARYDYQACVNLAKKFKYPVQVVTAGDGNYKDDKESYHSYGHNQNRRDVVKGTVHCFYENNTCDELLAKTDAWFSQFTD